MRSIAFKWFSIPKYAKLTQIKMDETFETDMDTETFAKCKNEYMEKIRLTLDECRLIEKKTVGQRNNPEWVQERKLRLTASYFGMVCKRKPTTKCGNLVKRILADDNLDNNESVAYGISHESVARENLQEYLGRPVKLCGLFVNPTLPFLGASPDGLVDDDKIVEIVCPYTAREITVEEGIKEKNIDLWKIVNGNMVLNKNSDRYYQIQGQLKIADKNKCYLVVWTTRDMKVEEIEKDEQFWADKMEEPLRKFYFDCLLPEIIDSRIIRGLPVREPPYILEAIREREQTN